MGYWLNTHKFDNLGDRTVYRMEEGKTYCVETPKGIRHILLIKKLDSDDTFKAFVYVDESNFFGNKVFASFEGKMGVMEAGILVPVLTSDSDSYSTREFFSKVEKRFQSEMESYLVRDMDNDPRVILKLSLFNKYLEYSECLRKMKDD